jgi:hypothetical protein
MIFIWLACLLAQNVPARVDLGRLMDAPEEHDGEVVEVRGVLHWGEEWMFLCSDRLPPGEIAGCQPLHLHLPEALPKKDRDTLSPVMKSEKQSYWVTVSGLLQATITHQWQSLKSYRCELFVEKVVRVERVRRK